MKNLLLELYINKYQTTLIRVKMFDIPIMWKNFENKQTKTWTSINMTVKPEPKQHRVKPNSEKKYDVLY